jgi:Domain of unknown function (DUF927)
MRSDAELSHFANVEDEATGEAFEVFRFTTVGGRRDRLFVEREVANDHRQLRSRLRKYNADLSTRVEDSEREVKEAIHAEPSRLFCFAAATGWLADNSGFVTPYGAIDPKKRRRKFLPPRHLFDAPRRGRKPEGDVAGWKRDVAGPCSYSGLGITLLSAAFAAPLLKLTGRKSFGVNVYGRAKTGKSIMLVAGSSVAGVGREEELPNWAATAAAVGELCRLHCDTFMPINEVGLLKKKDAYGIIQPTIYQFAEGRERDRHSKSGFATNDSSAYSRTIFGSSAEHSFDYYAELAGETRDEGELARRIETTAVRPGRASVFDRFPSSVAQEDRRRWAKTTLVRLREACERHHGVALAPYVEFLMSVLPTAQRRVEAYAAEFMDAVETTRLSPALEHAAENCAFICAGGCMAVDARVLPCQKADVLRAIRSCFRDLLQGRSEDERDDPLSAAKRLFRRRLESDVIYRQERPNDAFHATAYEGYAKEGQRSRYVIRAASSREWFKTEPGAMRNIIHWLEDKHCLLARQSRSTSNANRPSDWAERTLVWPDGKHVRSIVFYDPFVR